MLKPFSEKTLAKKYEQLGLSANKINLLHDYFASFSNLYGAISIREAWNVFREAEGGITIRKKEFVEFSGIVQREEQPYAILEIKELYKDETSELPQDRYIVNKDLILPGYYRFVHIYKLEEYQCDKPWFIPDKEELLSFKDDKFYKTEVGLKFKHFIENLKSTGKHKNRSDEPDEELFDINGRSTKNKKLSEIRLLTSYEQCDIDLTKSEKEKEKLRNIYHITGAEKILNHIKFNFRAGNLLEADEMKNMQFIADSLDFDYGVRLKPNQLEQFVDLYIDLNNNSNLWQNCGWTPAELSQAMSGGAPGTISVGPNIKKMFENGDLDRDEIEKHLNDIGLTLI